MPKVVQRSRCLVGDLATPPRFPAYRCDTPGLAGRAAPRTHFVADHPMFKSLSKEFSTDFAFELFSGEQRLTPTGRLAPKMLTEYVFEAKRRQLEPRLPSRLSSIFLFLERDCADIFQRRFAAQGRPVIYKCRARGWWFQAEGNTVYEASALLAPDNLSRSEFSEALEQVNECAASYWGNEFGDPSWPELLLDGEAELMSVEDEAP